MSLAIDIDKIQQVLLADGWHECARFKDGRLSFSMDAYEYIEPIEDRDPYVLMGGGSVDGVPSTGFSFIEVVNSKRLQVCGPITAVLAVRCVMD